MKVSATKQLTLQPKQYHSVVIGTTVELDSTDEADIREIAEREKLGGRSFTELSQNVAKFLANQSFNELLKEYKDLPSSTFNLAKA